MPSTTGAEFTFTQDVWPVCQLGMSDTRQYEPTTWMDVSCYVHEAELFRGRERFNDRFQPGTCTITFTNEDGWADIEGPAINVPSSNLRPGRQIRVGIRGTFTPGSGVQTRWLWYGYIDQVVPDYDPKLHDVVTITAIDALGEAGQTTTPAGPLVGVNETVTQRMHRVLDSIHWWGERRSIASTSTRVQGTTLGSPAIDLMSVAADSAGGVVFGSMNGDVVFKDLNWELYDNDIPPDGEIGNCDPGTEPIPGEPPYVDPTPGPVYDPCPPIPKPPECVEICVAPADGTVIEQGDSWRIYFQDGHIWYESAGHLWDMGEWTEEDDCMRICHPVPPPPPPNGPPPPPPPPTACRNPPCVPTVPGIPTPFPFTVDFLGYSDGGLAEGPQTVITVTGIAPGPDCMLVVLANGICDSGHVLDPFPINGGSITGGSLVFEEIDVREVAGLEGAESYAAAVEIGRDDPGTFDVVVDWSDDAASSYHIVTVWRVRKYRADLMTRLRLGAYLHAGSWDRKPPAPVPVAPAVNPPGKGFMQLELESVDTIGTQLVPYTRLTDIVIAQSLAESPNPPFGASFSDTDGTWWTPIFGDALAPAALVAGAATWTDTFDRAEIGPEWTNQEPLGYVIDSGAVVSTVNMNEQPYWKRGMLRTNWEVPPTETAWIEASFSNMTNGTGSRVGLYLRARGDVDDPVYHYLVVECYQTTSPPFAVNGLHISMAYTGGSLPMAPSVDHPMGTTGAITFRLEADPDGSARVYVNGALVQSVSLGAYNAFITDRGVGVAANWVTGVSPPRIQSATGNGVPVGGIIRKCSWVAGFRPDPLVPLLGGAPNVKWDEVNFGADNIQSSQAAVVMESGAAFGFTWKALAYHVIAPPSGATVAAGSHTIGVRPERLSMLIVFVAAFADAEVMAGVTVTCPGLTFDTVLTRATDSVGWGQGKVFSARLDSFPIDPVNPPEITVAWANAVEKIEFLIYEITNAGTVGVSGSATRGTHVSGSVTGGLVVPLSGPSKDYSVVLGFLGVSDEDYNESGSAAGIGFIEEIEVLPLDQYAWMSLESSAQVVISSVGWTSMDLSSAEEGKDAVALCVEVLPTTGFEQWSSYDPLMIGGARDAYGAPIYSVSGDTDGETDWDFDPTEPH